LYKSQKAIAALNFLHEETNKIVHKNMRLGLGVTGVCQSLNKIEWLDDCYKQLRAYDKQWSRERNYNESIKLTTIKPSGTNSLLFGATPGIHTAFSRYYIRRIRMSSTDKLVDVCRVLGYKVDFANKFDGSTDHDTCIVEFPCESGANAVLTKDLNAVQQLELLKKLQTVWADNAISVTVYYHADELKKIQEWLKVNYDNSVKSVSFLLHKEHGFKQAPYEEITKEQYDALLKNIKPCTLENVLIKDMSDEDMLESLECAGGACPIK
jgi:adenosylcobalamin-dependent ribonucleoside-triphosphate reductase